MNELLGNRIKELRNARHLKQEQVAELAGISRQKYIRIENGTNNITLEVLARIAKVLDVTVGDITKILDEPSMVTYRNGNGNDSSKMIVDMLDFFYANKHLYMKLQQNDNIQR
ncbi:MAG TPA: helix-turn-helix domain-containing protein [Candidatus Eisenbergiella stercoravium]|nr:helix-turn-helix domain-containing protein [Candidatus Eisenbergiella stercoravium]